MKTSSGLIAVCLLFLSLSILSAQQPSVILDNIQFEYKSLTEVKPILVNAEEKSIYLLPDECGEVLVIDLEDRYGWSSTLRDCPEINPIEIKPGERYQFPRLVIRYEQGEEKLIEEVNGKPGRYEIRVSYSFTPRYRNGKPEMKRTLRKEFCIVQ